MYQLAKHTRPEIEEYLGGSDAIILPIGAIEQHGRHMPLDNDAFTVTEIARRVGERTGVLVAPTMPYGYSVHHMNYKGSVTLGFDTLVHVCKDICESLISHGFRKIVVFNGHFGNSNAITEALRQIRDDTGVKVYSVVVFPLENGFGAKSLRVLEQEGGGHACEMETSVGLYLGQRILMGEAKRCRQPEETPKVERDFRGKMSVAYYFEEITDSGALGDPTLATEGKGKVMVEETIDELVKFVEELKRG